MVFVWLSFSSLSILHMPYVSVKIPLILPQLTFIAAFSFGTTLINSGHGILPINGTIHQTTNVFF